MNTLRTAAALAATTFIAAASTGCSGLSQSLPSAGAPQAAAAQTAAARAANVPFSKRTKSWISRDAKSASQLLYVANDFASTGSTVNIYAWPSQTQLGQLTGFEDLTGLCTDKKGDVYVLDAERNLATEYARASVVPIASLSVSNPEGCAVDFKTGNLAITSLIGSSAGSLLVFSHARGTPKAYSGANIYEYFFPAYDDAGNLFVDGFPVSGNAVLAELPSGGSALEAVSMNQTVEFPGGLQWDGKYLAIGDQYQNAIYQLSISGTTATLAGTTSLGDANYMFDFDVTNVAKGEQGNAVVAASPNNASVSAWSYPAGGQPTQSFSGLNYPEGVAITGK